MIIKWRRLYFSLVRDGFVKANFDFPIRGRDLRPLVSPGRRFCVFLSLCHVLFHTDCSYPFFRVSRKKCASFLLSFRTSHEEEQPDNVFLLREMDSRICESTILAGSLVLTHSFIHLRIPQPSSNVQLSKSGRHLPSL